MTLGLTTIDPATVTVSGAASIVARVDTVRADVTIQATGIDVDNDIQLVPVDKLGNELRPLNVTPATARVTIPVFSDRQSRTLPVNPIISGTPAAGFEIESVTVEPQVTLVAGDADQLAELARVDTEPISVLGVSADEVVVVGLAPPTGVVAIGDEQISVSIKIRPVTATRTFSAGLRLIGAGSDMSYAVSVAQVLVTIGGSIADLNRLAGAALVMDLDVSGLKAGVNDVPVSANLPAGTTLVDRQPGNGPGHDRCDRQPHVTRTLGRSLGIPGRRVGDGPPLRHGWHPRDRQRGPQATDRLRPRPSRGDASGTSPVARSSSARTRGGRVTCSWAPSRPVP